MAGLTATPVPALLVKLSALPENVLEVATQMVIIDTLPVCLLNGLTFIEKADKLPKGLKGFLSDFCLFFSATLLISLYASLFQPHPTEMSLNMTFFR